MKKWQNSVSGGGKSRDWVKGHKRTFWGSRLSLRVWIIQMFTFVKTQWTYTLKDFTLKDKYWNKFWTLDNDMYIGVVRGSCTDACNLY